YINIKAAWVMWIGRILCYAASPYPFGNEGAAETFGFDGRQCVTAREHGSNTFSCRLSAHAIALLQIGEPRPTRWRQSENATDAGIRGQDRRDIDERKPILVEPALKSARMRLVHDGCKRHREFAFRIGQRKHVEFRDVIVADSRFRLAGDVLSLRHWQSPS